MYKLPTLIAITLSLLSLISVDSYSADVIITHEDNDGLTLEYKPEVIGQVEEIDGTLILQLKNSDIERIPGAPLVPVRMITVAVPPGSDPTVRVLESYPGTSYKGKLPFFTESTIGEIKVAAQALTPDQGIGSPIKRSFAGLETVRIPVYPVRVHSGNNQVDLASSILIRVTFNPPVRTQSAKSIKPNLLAEKVVINYRQAAKWGRATIADFGEANWPSSKLFKFEIDREGIFKLTFDEMVANGINLNANGVPSNQVKLFGNGGLELPADPAALAPLGLAEVPIFISDGGDGTFQTGDWILFYGRDAGGWVQDEELGWKFNIHHYSNKNVYWLSFDPGSGPGKRMTGISVNDPTDFIYSKAISRYYLENDNFIYYPGDVIGTGKEWYGHSFDGVSNFSYSFPCIDPDTTSDADLSLNIRNLYPNDARMAISINGNDIGTYVPPPASTTSSGYSFTDFDAPLRNGTNIITFEQLIPGNRAYFDWFEIKYVTNLRGARTFEQLGENGIATYRVSGLDDPWIFDITYHDSVKLERTSEIRVANTPDHPARYMALDPDYFLSVQTEFVAYLGPEMHDVENLWSERNQADVLLITPDAYWNTLEPLLDYYGEKGLANARRVQLSEIYNRFSGGLQDISAIRNMLMYAAANWDDSPDYVVFCGDGDYNYRNIDRSERQNLVPPYEDGRFGSDDWFVDFTNYQEDGVRHPLPEMIIGRLTAQTSSELAAMVDKIVAYELSPEYGTWRTRMTFVADDETAESATYYETEHVIYNERIINNTVPPEFERDKVYLTEYAREFGREKPQAAEHLVESINRGTLLVNYMGHGNPTLWAHEHVFVQSRDMPLIETSSMQPLYIAFTCDWAYWDDPSAQSFPEQLLARRNGGAISVVASTRLTGGGANYNLATNFFSHLLLEDDVSIGEALMMAKHAYRGSNSATYHVLGDPTQHLAVPKLRGNFISLSPLPLVPLQFSSVSGEVRTKTGTLMPNFSGIAEFKVVDTEVPKEYAIYVPADNPYFITLNYNLIGSNVYKGAFSIQNGNFDGNFIVPRDVTLGGKLGRVLTYFYNDDTDGFFVEDSVSYATSFGTAQDAIPPEIDLYFDNRAFRSGDAVNSDPLLIVDVFDSSGVNLTGAMGHGVYARIDDRAPIDLTTYFSYDLDDYQRGSLERRIGPLDAGMHSIEIEAWDSFNNLAVKEMDIEVVASSGGLIVQNILNYPNPFKNNTSLTFQVTSSNFPVEYEIRIFTVGGRLVKDMRGRVSGQAETYVDDILWDGRDNHGRPIGNGVYLCKVEITDSNGEKADGMGKIVYAQ
ncbi:type IX secretion system sortase PorU [Calditrichota bacterium]